MYTDLNSNLNTLNKDVYLDSGIQAIKNSIKNIILTQKGQVPGNPNFGTNIDSVLGEIIDDITFDLAEEMIIESIEEFESRVTISDIIFTPYYDENVLSIECYFIVKATNEEANVTVPLQI